MVSWPLLERVTLALLVILYIILHNVIIEKCHDIIVGSIPCTIFLGVDIIMNGKFPRVFLLSNPARGHQHHVLSDASPHERQGLSHLRPDAPK